MKTILRVFQYVKRYPWLAFATLACAIFGTLLVAVFPGVTKGVVDEVIGQNRRDLLVPLTLTALGAFFLRDLLNGVRIILNNTFEQKVIFDLRSDLYDHIQKLPLTWFDNRATGDLMTRVLEDVNAMERVLIDGIEQGIVAVLQIGVVVALLFYYSPQIGWLTLAPVPFLILGAMAYTLTAHTRYRTQRKAASALNSLLHDNLAGIRQIKAFGQEESGHEQFNVKSDLLRKSTLVVMKVWALYNPSMGFLSSCGLVLVTGFGALQVLNGEIGLGAFVACLTVVTFLYEPIGRLHQLNQLFQSGRAAGERVFEILDEEQEPMHVTAMERLMHSAQDVDIPRLKGDVRYCDVGFEYAEDIAVLHHLSLHAQPGETVALVGPTGAGKSSVVNLLCRFYEYQEGEIYLDGTPLKEVPRQVLRENIGVVTQESFLFNGSVRDNLRIGRQDADDASLWQALEAANAAEFVRRLSEGLDTVVGERGVKLSVGEKQRISIARVLLKDPPILILDEATASVDNETERLIQAALDRLMRERTSFVIAHRLSTIRNADQILVMQAGRIVENGRHSELLARGGLYARLHEAHREGELEAHDAVALPLL